MLKDKEDHEVKVIGVSNGHQMIYGNSGQGKTYFLVRELEKFCREKKRVLVLDYSGSYTTNELQEKRFLYPDKIRRFTLSECPMQWLCRTKDTGTVAKDIADALSEVLRCGSYFQRKLLLEAVERTMKREENIEIADIVETLEHMLQEEAENKNVGNAENLQRLLTRLSPYAGIQFSMRSKAAVIITRRLVTIVDMMGYPETQRRFLTELIVSLLWREIYRQEKPNRCDVLLLDEMQFLSLKEGSTLSSMLREGRKKQLDIILSTQYIGHYDRAELRAIQQADNMIIFRPAPEDYQRSAQIIAPENCRDWIPILSQLEKGEAVLKGHYYLNGSGRIIKTPIVIQVE